MKVRYTLLARDDLQAIVDYLAEQSPQGASRVKKRVRDVERLLSQFPEAGSPTRLVWLRRIKLPAYPYLVFYEVTEGAVIIHAIRHAARNPTEMPG